MTSYAPDHWNTNHEIEFLRELGSNSNAFKLRGTTRKEMLWNYYNSIDKRIKWDYVDRDFVKKECERMLRHELIKEEILKKGDSNGMAKR